MKLADRMHSYEAAETERRAARFLPLIARLDGRSFSALTKKRFNHFLTSGPFSQIFSDIMISVTKQLMVEYGARLAYTQSDEISLVWHLPEESLASYPFDGRFHKLTSTLAGTASANFALRHVALALTIAEAEARVPEESLTIDNAPVFDCRVWQVPSLAEAANYIVWRELDAKKNSISMLAQHHFSHHELMHVNSDQKLIMLRDRGVHWQEIPTHFRRGTLFHPVKTLQLLTKEELAKIPHRPPDGEVLRTKITPIQSQTLMLAETRNRVDVLFHGEQKWVPHAEDIDIAKEGSTSTSVGQAEGQADL